MNRGTVVVAVAVALGFAVVIGSLQWRRDIPTVNPRGTAELVLDGARVSVEYGRPAVENRRDSRRNDVPLNRAPSGFVWRAGADRSTTFDTEADLSFDGVVVPKGAYSLFAKRLDASRWELLFNTQTGQWGLEHDASLDFASVPLEWNRAAPMADPFTIELDAVGETGRLRLRWGRHALEARFRLNED